MRNNLLREKLGKGEVAVGVLIREPAIESTEILALLGFDYLYIDCQHSPMTVESVAQLIRTAELRGITPLVRVPENKPESILRYLDVGAMGIIVSDMDSAEEAQKAVKAVKYPPEGERGLSPVRSGDFGLREPLGEYVKTANLETMVLGVLESKEGVERIDEILGTEGLDGVTIGTTDLSKSLGVPGERNHPLVLEAVDKILLTGKKTGKFIATSARKGESPRQYIEKGFNMVTKGLSTLLVEVGQQFLEQARG